MNLFDKQYKPRNEVDKETLKKKVFAYCCIEEYENKEYTGTYRDEDIDTDCLPAWEAFKQADFDLDKFFLEECYLLIPDSHIRCQILVECLRLVKPISDYIFEWMTGYLDFGPIDDNVFKYLYFCRTDEEIWDLLGFGIGNIESLFLWYSGIDPFPTYSIACDNIFQGKKDEAKAKRMLDYILTESAHTTDKVRAEILGQMGYDGLSMYVENKDKGVDRYREQAEHKKMGSLWQKWHLFSMNNDLRLRKDAVKYLKRAAEMGHPEAISKLSHIGLMDVELKDNN
jgi:hypothetical protein